MTEDMMVGQHHQLNGHESEHALGVGDGQGSLVCYNPWGRNESDIFKRLNQNQVCQIFPSKEQYLLILQLQSPSIVIWEHKKIKFVIASTFSPSICCDGIRCHDLSFLTAKFQASSFTQEALQFLFAFCHQSGIIAYLRLLIFLPATLIPALHFP